MSEKDQLEYLQGLPLKALRALKNRYIECDQAGVLSLRVYGEILSRLDPSEYDPQYQPSNLRATLTPESLKRVREESYRHSVQPFLNLAEALQASFIESLDVDALRGLQGLLLRYSKECGGGARCRRALSAIHQAILTVESNHPEN